MPILPNNREPAMYICPSVLMIAVCVLAEAIYLAIPRNPLIAVGILAILLLELANSPS
jgi:hypothetical protein